MGFLETAEENRKRTLERLEREKKEENRNISSTDRPIVFLGLPSQLQNTNFRFIKVRENKAPLEQSWQKDNNYLYTESDFQNFANEHKRYGVVTGFGNLLVIDFDSKEVQDDVEPQLPETFTVKTAGRGLHHLYYIVDKAESSKILNEEKDTYADIQGEGKQVIGPGTIFNGKQYVVEKDLPIAQTTLAEIKLAFSKWQKIKEVETKERSNKEVDEECRLIKEKIKITDLLTDYGVDITRHPTSCPLHASKGGRCLSFTSEVFHCYHCSSKGSIFNLVMAKDGVTFPEAKKRLAKKAGIELITFEGLTDEDKIVREPIPKTIWDKKIYGPAVTNLLDKVCETKEEKDKYEKLFIERIGEKTDEKTVKIELKKFIDILDKQFRSVPSFERFKKSLKEELRKIKKEDEAIGLGLANAPESKYSLKPYPLGWLFWKDNIKKVGDAIEVVAEEFASFDELERQRTLVLDITLDNERYQNEYKVKNKEGLRMVESEIELKNILFDSRRPNRTKIEGSDEVNFVRCMRHLPEVETKKINAYGFKNGTYYDEKTGYKLYNVSFSKEGSDIIKREDYATPTDEYKDFMEQDVEEDTITKILDLLNNKFWRSEYEKKMHKVILAWSISSVLKMELRRLGVQLHPILVCIGERRKGKTTAMNLFISEMWCTPQLQPDHFEGAKGARLKQIDNNLFPIYCDENISLDKFSQILKSATTLGYMKIPRGRKDGSFEDNIKFFNLALSANKFRVEDPALKDRMLIYNYLDPGNPRMENNELIWLKEHIKCLGKHIYDSLYKFNYRQMIKEIEEGIKDKHPRDKHKLMYVRVGEKIIESIGLYKDVVLDTEWLIKPEETLSISIKDEILDIIKSILTRQEYRLKVIADNDSVLTIPKIMADNKDINPDYFEILTNKGIWITAKEGSVAVTRAIIPLINEELLRRKNQNQYKDLKTLASDLEKEEGVIKVKKPNNGRTCVRGIEVFTKEDMVEEMEEETKKEDTWEKKIDESEKKEGIKESNKVIEEYVKSKEELEEEDEEKYRKWKNDI